MITPNDLDNISQPLEQRAGNLEDLAWAYIVSVLANAESSRDHSNDDNLNADDWRRELVSHADDVLKYVRKQNNQSFNQIIKSTDKAINSVPLQAQASNEARMQSLIQQGLVKTPRSLAESEAVNKIVERGRADANHYLGLAKKNMPKHAAKTFKSIVSDATLSIKNGSTPREALARASEQWAQAGVPALVDSVGRRWHPDTYLRMVIQTQVQSVTNDVTIQRSRDYTGLVKVSSHAGCRPTHLQYQGNVYSVSDTNLSEYPDLNEATNFGSAGGLCGINCHHYVMTYVPGYDLPDVDTLDPKSNNEQYQLTQTQRRLEREVRAAKRKMTVAQRFGSDGDVANARRLVSKRQANVRQFVMRHEDVLRRDYSRETNHVTAWIPKATPKLKMNLQYFTNGHVYKQGEILKALPKVSEAVYPQSKFVDYFLSPTHPVGQNKAEVFRNVLGYTQDNWTDLRDQIKRELPNTKARARGDEGHGPKFETIISITGPTGRTADVMVSWIIDADNDGELRLTTAHVMEEGRKKWN
jgi:vacuolar-type H+-ATPase subunit H